MRWIRAKDDVVPPATDVDGVEQDVGRELGIVEQFATAAASASGLQELVRIALESVKLATNCAACYYLLVQGPDNGPQKHILYYLSAGEALARENPISSSLLAETSERSGPISVPVTTAALRELDLETGLKTLLLVPTRKEGRAIGTMILGDTTGHGFTPRQMTMANIVACQLATAVENIQLNQRIEESSGADPLTGLPNRSQFLSCLEYEVGRATRYRRWLSIAVVEIDALDDFRTRYGGPAAEAALCDVARIIQKHTRLIDFLARWSESQFVVILPETDAAGARIYAERVRRAIAGLSITSSSSKGEVWLTASVGLTSYQASVRGQLRADAVMSRAEGALSCAKRDGGNRVCES
ncbi:MAG: sensor domain-containing diguanylate cyclase [Dehalococcoidia bacterium]